MIMDYNAYKRIFWGMFLILAALSAMAVLSFGTIFLFIPVAEKICSNPYTKTLAVFAVIALIMFILKNIERNK